MVYSEDGMREFCEMNESAVVVVVVVVYMIAWLSDISLSADNVFVITASFHSFIWVK